LNTLQGSSQNTDIIGALSTVLEENRTTPLAGVLLLSDGAHHGQNTGIEFLRQAGVPIVAVGVGNPETYRDIRVAAVHVPTLAFLHYPVEISATIQVWGYRGERLPVVLKQAGRVVFTQSVSVNSDVFEQEVQFE